MLNGLPHPPSRQRPCGRRWRIRPGKIFPPWQSLPQRPDRAAAAVAGVAWGGTWMCGGRRKECVLQFAERAGLSAAVLLGGGLVVQALLLHRCVVQVLPRLFFAELFEDLAFFHGLD